MKIEMTAANKKTGITIAELQQFINQTENMGIDPRSTVNAIVGFGSQIKTLKCGDE